jgi:nucleotide-binding universal stress UspA family protein
MRVAETGTRAGLKNILLATDFTPEANAALSYAGELAQRVGAKLHALHVKEMPNYALPPETWRNADETCERNARELRKILRAEFPTVETDVLIEEGNVWHGVATAVRKNRIDLIVVGTEGRTGAGKLLLGSQAEEILRHVACPVLVIGPHARTKTWSEGEPAEFLFATDFGPDSQAAAHCAIALAEDFHGHLTLLHVIASPKTGELVHATDLATASERKLRELIHEEDKSLCKPQYIVEEGAPAEKILEIADGIHADVIVLGVHEPTGIPGAATHLPVAVAHKIISRANCPVLALHASHAKAEAKS